MGWFSSSRPFRSPSGALPIGERCLQGTGRSWHFAWEASWLHDEMHEQIRVSTWNREEVEKNDLGIQGLNEAWSPTTP